MNAKSNKIMQMSKGCQLGVLQWGGWELDSLSQNQCYNATLSPISLTSHKIQARLGFDWQFDNCQSSRNEFLVSNVEIGQSVNETWNWSILLFSSPSFFIRIVPITAWRILRPINPIVSHSTFQHNIQHIQQTWPLHQPIIGFSISRFF